MIYQPDEIKILRAGGKILAETLRTVAAAVRPGIPTRALEDLTRQLLKNHPGASPAFLGYDSYPAALCVSINEEVVHGLPGKRVIRPGDLVSIDLGVKYEGLITDAAISVLVPPSTSDVDSDRELKNKLLRVTQECLTLAVKQARPGKTIGDIGQVIQSHARSGGFAVVYQLVGHGVGKKLHEEPQVPNFGKSGEGEKLTEGMVLAIEPMLVMGKPEVMEDKTTLAWRTVNGSPAAHFEHTIAVTAKGPEILTLV